MSDKTRILGTFSRLLSYPDGHYIQLAELLYVILQNELPEAAKCVSKFGQFVEQCTETELEEAYTRTFDVNPACALEVGWHLFGEDYVRGQFLVRMREELAKYAIPESRELPDHLTHVLAVIAAMPEDEAARLAHACLFPALAKMRQSLEKNESPYRHLIRPLVLFLEYRYGPAEAWPEDEPTILSSADASPGQNGPRPPGLGDPLRAFPMPDAVYDNDVEIVPLQMQFSLPGSRPVGPEGRPEGRPS